MTTMQVDIVTPDRKVFSEQAEMVIARTTEGEIGILPNHSPLAATLKISAVRVKKDNSEVVAAISGGFIEVRPKAAKERAEKRLQDKREDIDYRRAELALNRALNRLDISNRQ